MAPGQGSGQEEGSVLAADGPPAGAERPHGPGVLPEVRVAGDGVPLVAPGTRGA